MTVSLNLAFLIGIDTCDHCTKVGWSVHTSWLFRMQIEWLRRNRRILWSLHNICLRMVESAILLFEKGAHGDLPADKKVVCLCYNRHRVNYSRTLKWLGFGHNGICTVKLPSWTKCIAIHSPNGKAPRALSNSNWRHKTHLPIPHRLRFDAIRWIKNSFSNVLLHSRVQRGVPASTNRCVPGLSSRLTGSSGMMSTL